MFLQQLEQINSLDNYQKNLRYLELPVQPLTNRKGFEIQFLSEELIEDAIEEMEDGEHETQQKIKLIDVVKKIESQYKEFSKKSVPL